MYGRQAQAPGMHGLQAPIAAAAAHVLVDQACWTLAVALRLQLPSVGRRKAKELSSSVGVAAAFAPAVALRLQALAVLLDCR